MNSYPFSKLICPPNANLLSSSISFSLYSGHFFFHFHAISDANRSAPALPPPPGHWRMRPRWTTRWRRPYSRTSFCDSIPPCPTSPAPAPVSLPVATIFSSPEETNSASFGRAPGCLGSTYCSTPEPELVEVPFVALLVLRLS
jgi:hypothetical protein